MSLKYDIFSSEKKSEPPTPKICTKGPFYPNTGTPRDDKKKSRTSSFKFQEKNKIKVDYDNVICKIIDSETFEVTQKSSIKENILNYKENDFVLLYPSKLNKLKLEQYLINVGECNDDLKEGWTPPPFLSATELLPQIKQFYFDEWQDNCLQEDRLDSISFAQLEQFLTATGELSIRQLNFDDSVSDSDSDSDSFFKSDRIILTGQQDDWQSDVNQKSSISGRELNKKNKNSFQYPDCEEESSSELHSDIDDETQQACEIFFDVLDKDEKDYLKSLCKIQLFKVPENSILNLTAVSCEHWYEKNPDNFLGTLKKLSKSASIEVMLDTINYLKQLPEINISRGDYNNTYYSGIIKKATLRKAQEVGVIFSFYKKALFYGLSYNEIEELIEKYIFQRDSEKTLTYEKLENILLKLAQRFFPNLDNDLCSIRNFSLDIDNNTVTNYDPSTKGIIIGHTHRDNCVSFNPRAAIEYHEDDIILLGPHDTIDELYQEISKQPDYLYIENPLERLPDNVENDRQIQRYDVPSADVRGIIEALCNDINNNHLQNFITRLTAQSNDDYDKIIDAAKFLSHSPTLRTGANNILLVIQALKKLDELKQNHNHTKQQYQKKLRDLFEPTATPPLTAHAMAIIFEWVLNDTDFFEKLNRSTYKTLDKFRGFFCEDQYYKTNSFRDTLCFLQFHFMDQVEYESWTNGKILEWAKSQTILKIDSENVFFQRDNERYIYTDEKAHEIDIKYRAKASTCINFNPPSGLGL